jgi:CarboxypepD_reg-like domain/TonB-dependent Receptor Plug Domain
VFSLHSNKKGMRALLLSFTLLLTSVIVFGQKGKVEGKVTDAKTGQPLTGVSVINKQNGKGTSTDIEGRYGISIVGTTKVSLVFTYNGVTQQVDDIEIKEGVVTVQDVALTQREKTEDAVVVRSASSSRKANAASLLTFQKNNSALSSGLAADFIKRTPDKNTGEVLRRVSGTSIQDNKFVIVRGLSDRYNAAFINGAALPSSEPDKKAFSFDVIPSTLIDNIIINKTATPDITGEFAGGLVQIQTKDIPSQNELSLGVSLGFNTQSIGKDFISNERGSNEIFGFSSRNLSSAYPRKYLDFAKLGENEKSNIAKSFNDNAYNEVTSVAGPIQQYNLTLANVQRFKSGAAFGTIIGLSYRSSKLIFDASKSLFEKGNNGQAFFDYQDIQNKYSVNAGGIVNFAWTYKKNKIAFKNLFNQLLEDNYYQRKGINTENLQDVSLRSSVLNQRSLYSAQLEGTHELTFKKIKFNWNLNFSLNNKSQPDLRVQTYGKSIGVNEPYRINLRGNNTNRFFSELNDKAFGYNASLSLPFTIGKQKQTLKVGGAATIRLRDFKAFIFGFSEPTDLTLNTLPYNEIFKAENFREGGFKLNTDLQNPQDRYFGASALSAGFIMFDNKLSEKLRLVWGARVEYFEQFLKSNKQGTDKAQIVDRKKLDFLPSLNFTISPSSKINIRVAASRTVARPEFREIANFTFFDFEQIASTTGNGSLLRSSIINTDIRFEYYPKSGEVLSFGAFYKNFSDPIELRLNSASVATRRQYEFLNAAEANLFGVEAEFRKSLSFLSGNSNKFSWLENLYFNGNVSIITSKVDLGNLDINGNKLPATSRPLQGQSPYLINAGFQYDGKKGTNLSLLYNRIGERLTLVGNDDFGNLYEIPRNLVDLQISQKILKEKAEIKLTISDLFNNQALSYEDRGAVRNYTTREDRNFSIYQPGTTISVGFTYSFKK